MNSRRVVVTGIGAVSSIGNSVDAMWESLLAGKSGIGPVTKFDASAYRTRIAGEVRDLDVSKYMTEKEARRLDDFCLYAIAAGDEAMKDAGLGIDLRDGSLADPNRVGVCVGSGIGGMRTMEEQCMKLLQQGPSKVSPFLIPMMIIDMASGSLSMRYGAKGPNHAVVSACSTASHSIGESYWMVKRGDADIMITGGAEASVSRLGFAGFCSMKALSQRNDEPTKASRPFDKDRDGFVMSEGAGILILEEYEHAKARGAKIYAELVGYGCSSDAYHITSPAEDGAGAAKAMENAMKDAGVSPEEVTYINAHGTGTKLNDLFETRAIKLAFGDHAKNVHINSTKSMIGHLLGAAGAVEFITCVKELQENYLHATVGYRIPDEECDLDYCKEPVQEEVPYALTNSLGFGGHNASLLVKKYTE